MTLDRNYLIENMEENEIKKLLKESLKLNKETNEIVKSVKKYLVVQRIFFFVKVLIIVIPLILGIIYLPPLFKEFIPRFNETIDQYQSLFNFSNKIEEFDSDILLDQEKLKNLSPEKLEKIRNVISN
ncbi:hypothetical protein K8R62_01440 [bacterium]|nr:hypothetical protein [bacterium]